MILQEERSTALALAPELVAQLESSSLLALERGTAQQLVNLFRSFGQPGLAISNELGGGGVSAAALVQLHMWVASRCPSLAVMMTMHHHTVAGMMMGSAFFPEISGLLRMVAHDRLLVASGFSEGRAHAPNLESKMAVRKTDGGYIINGSKKPCTMTHHFDVMTLGINYLDPTGTNQMGIGMAFAADPAIERHPFWQAPHLKAADSNAVVLRDLFIPDAMMCSSATVDAHLDESQRGAGENMFAIWFQLLASASYLGMAAALAERALDHKKGSQDDRAMLLIELQGATLTLNGLATLVDAQRFDAQDLARAQAARFSVQETVNRISTKAFEVLGGMAFLASEEPAYLLVATRLMAFHPSSKLASAAFIAEQLA